MKATYRPVTPEDINMIASMRRDFYAIDGGIVDMAVSQQQFAAFIADERLGKAWLIELENQPIGYVILTFLFSFEFRGMIAFVDELYIAESGRGKGIGKATMDFIKEEAERSGIKMLYLEVDHHNAVAQKLYLSAGFETHWRQLMQLKIN